MGQLARVLYFEYVATPLRAGIVGSVNRRDPSERIWTALKELAQSEAVGISQSQAIKRVKAVARREGALELPERALMFYADEYRDMVSKKQKSG